MKHSILSTVILLTLSSAPSLAQDSTLAPVVDAANEITQAAKSSQHKVATIADSTQERLQQYKQITRQIQGLEVYTQQLQRQLQSQQAEKDELNRSIDEVSVVERQITPLMLQMVESLAVFIDLDVPFLPEERQQRLAGLQALMDRADVAVSEKFRRVMEAFQIEADYGRTIEAYNGVMEIAGQPQDVEFLRVGRTALIYQTRDGSALGVWNQQQRQWEPLASSYASAVQKAIRVAKKQLAPDLLMLPIHVANSAVGE